jgi:hypothetical protein
MSSSPRYIEWPRVEVSYGERGMTFVSCAWRDGMQGGATIVLIHPSEAEIAEAKAAVLEEVRLEEQGRQARAN